MSSHQNKFISAFVRLPSSFHFNITRTYRNIYIYIFTYSFVSRVEKRSETARGILKSRINETIPISGVAHTFAQQFPARELSGCRRTLLGTRKQKKKSTHEKWSSSIQLLDSLELSITWWSRFYARIDLFMLIKTSPRTLIQSRENLILFVRHLESFWWISNREERIRSLFTCATMSNPSRRTYEK